MQLRMNIATREQVSNCWAFAVDQNKARYKKYRTVQKCVITACSQEAKTFGIQAGMLYDEAKLLLPDLKIMIYNW